MRRLVAILAAGMLAATACSDRVPASSAEFPSTTATVPPATTSPSTSEPAGTSESTTAVPTGALDQGAPRFGGEVIVAGVAEPLTLNPYAPGGQDDMVAVIGQAHLAGVFEIDPDTLELIPELAVRVPTVENGDVVINDDGSMDVTWELRPDVRWSDGEPMTGADLAFTLEFQEASRECSELGVAAPALPDHEVIAEDESSLRVHFAVASLEHELLLRWVVPRHAVVESDYCLDWNVAMWPAAGPFHSPVWNREAAERTIRLTRNEHYWRLDAAGHRLPYLDAVEFRFAENSEELVDGFSDREYDVISPQVPIAEIPVAFWEDGGADVQIVPGLIWEHINFQFGPANRNPGSLNRDVDFRRAIMYALDRQALLEDAGVRGMEVLNGILSRFSASSTGEPWAAYEQDLEKARRLLAAACDRAGRDCAAEPPVVIFSTTSNADFRRAVSEQLATQLAAIGIEVTLELEDSQIFFGETVEGGTWDIGSWAWAGTPGSAGIVDFFDRFDPGGPPSDSRNYYNWGTPGSTVEADEAVAQFELLLERLRTTSDSAEIAALGRQAEKLLADNVVVIPVGAGPVVGVVWADEIQGFRMNPSFAGPTWNIEHWYRVDG